MVGEPTSLDRTISLRGFVVFEVKLVGRAAHSSMPAEGVNAVTHLGRLLAAVEETDAQLRGGGSLIATVAAGGLAPFSLAASAVATIERRTVPGESVEQRRDRDRPDPRPVAVGPIPPSPPRRGWWSGSGLLAAGRSAVRRRQFAGLLDDALRNAPGRTGEPLAAPYWMEAPLFAAAGIPAVVCGPSGGGLHAVDEWVDLRQVRAYAAGLVAAFRAYAAAGPDAD